MSSCQKTIELVPALIADPVAAGTGYPRWKRADEYHQALIERFSSQSRQCHNCFHLGHACKAASQKACSGFEQRQQGIREQIRLAEVSIRWTGIYGSLLLAFVGSSFVWAYLGS